jgi:hypothetical protein
VAAKNYERADAYFHNPHDRFLRDLNEKYWRFIARAELEPSSFRALLRGQRRVILRVVYHDAGPARDEEWAVPVTRAGVLKPQPVLRTGGGSMGGGLAGPTDHWIRNGRSWPS